MPPIGCLALGERAVVPGQLRMRGAARQLPTLPTCDVTITRSPQTMGDDVPSPASAARHAMFSLALHVVGRPVSEETP